MRLETPNKGKQIMEDYGRAVCKCGNVSGDTGAEYQGVWTCRECKNKRSKKVKLGDFEDVIAALDDLISYAETSEDTDVLARAAAAQKALSRF